MSKSDRSRTDYCSVTCISVLVTTGNLLIDRCWIVGVGESWSEWFTGCQCEWGAWWDRRRCSVNSHHMGGTVCICRDPPILYRKSLSFYEEFNIIIYALSIKIRGKKKITLKLQICKYIHNKFFYILQSIEFFNCYVHVLYEFEH